MVKNIYVSLCPKCISKDTLNTFKPLVERGAIIPALAAPYAAYPDVVQSIVASHDHISCFEFNAYKSVILWDTADEMMCSHCAQLKHKNILKIMKKSDKLAPHKEKIDIIMSNLFPFIYPDSELVDAFEAAVKRESGVRIEELVRMSFVINSMRSSQALNAQIVMVEDDIEKIPVGFAKATDEALSLSANVNKQISDGLGLTIPIGMPIEKYIELARDVQPRMSSIIRNIIGDADETGRLASASLLSNEVMKINREIERIKDLKRHLLLEAAVSFYSNTRALASTIFIAGSMGLAGGLVGCIGGLAAGVAKNIAKKKGIIIKNPDATRLGQAIRRDLQPYLDRLIAKYVGGYLPAISVLSLRKRISDAEAA